MPKIRINEYDMTGVIQKSPISNIIYIPILTDKDVPLTEKGKVVSICYSRNELKNRIESHLVKKVELPSTEGTPSETAVAATKESIELAKKSRVMYNIATRLIDLGFPVLVEGVAVAEEQVTVGEEKVKVKVVKIPDASINLLKDKSLFDIRFLTSGIDVVNNESLIGVADKRQDCIALINLEGAYLFSLPKNQMATWASEEEVDEETGEVLNKVIIPGQLEVKDRYTKEVVEKTDIKY